MKLDYVLVLTQYGLGMFIAFLIGACSSLLGIGGGPLIVPLLLYGFGLSDSVARGTSLALLIVNGVLGLYSRHLAKMELSQYFDPKFFLIMVIPLAIGSLFTIQIIQIVQGVNFELDPIWQSLLRKLLGIVLVVIGLVIFIFEQYKK